MTQTHNDVDLRWAHPALAKSARRVFRRIRRDAKGRLWVADMRQAFGRHGAVNLDGQMASIFVIILAACEAAVALAIVLNIYQQFNTVNVDEVSALKE